ncbi:MAG: glutathione S-transferase family protein [Ketobacter sp.]|nr:MAG: glutathione S-transferase family protein [Ketobacter sp.]
MERTTMYNIYGFGTFNPLKVVFTAEELGLEYQFHPVDLAKGENRHPDYLAIHPLGKIPALEHNGNTFIESASICRYMANCSGQQLYSQDPVAAAQIDQVMDLMQTHIGRWLGAFFWQEIVMPMMKQQPDQAVLAEAKGWLDKQLPVIDNILAKKAFLGGSRFSIADTFAFPLLNTSEITSVDLGPYQHIQRWYGEISSRPALQRAKQQIGQMK